jgi:phage baseplate assembly protein W
MASIKLNSLQEPKKPISSYTYSDLYLDLKMGYTKNNELLKQSEVKDLTLSYDYGAIKNSLFNLFTTVPGQKILNPFFGLNLIQYIFEPCSKDTAELIGQAIYDGITTFEPRVEVKKIQVVAITAKGRAKDPTSAIDVRFVPEDADANQYQVTLIINVPTVSQNSFTLVGTLNNSGFFFNT